MLDLGLKKKKSFFLFSFISPTMCHRSYQSKLEDLGTQNHYIDTTVPFFFFVYWFKIYMNKVSKLDRFHLEITDSEQIFSYFSSFSLLELLRWSWLSPKVFGRTTEAPSTGHLSSHKPFTMKIEFHFPSPLQKTSSTFFWQERY